MSNQSIHQDDVPYPIRSKMECLYVYLDQIRQQEIQRLLDTDYWQKRIIQEQDPTTLKNLEGELYKYKEELHDLQKKIRITKTLIEEEKALLSPEEVATILEHVKLRSQIDMVRNAIDFFTMSLIPHEVDVKFWQSKLLEQTQPEVRQAIEANVLPNLTRSIALSVGGKKNAEDYLRALEDQEEGGTANGAN